MSELDKHRVLPDAVRYIQPKLTPARLERVWGQVRARLPLRARRRRAWVWVGALASAAVVVLVLLMLLPKWDAPPDENSLLAGAVLETAGDALTMGLVDGSSLKLAKRSRVEVAESGAQGVRLRLKRGRIECNVRPRDQAHFVVVTEGVEVRVVGTRFSVATERDAQSRRVEVQVQRGVVEVRSSNAPGEVTRVTAGRSWSQVTRTGPVEQVRKPAKSPVVEKQLGVPAKPSAEKAAGNAPPGARELLEQANELRRAGQARAAAERYERLLARHGSDPRAGLAAFELGRLRMDRFGDVRGAIFALERAIVLAPGSGFREDALARLVTAQARAGNQSGCEQARDRYLKSYPSGVHRQSVVDQCPRR